MFEYYVLRYDFNKHKVYNFNIFNNIHVNEWTEKAIKKYLRSPSKYKYIKQYRNNYLNKEEIASYGFDALCDEIKSILKNQLWSRREYEISVSDAFVCEISDVLRKFDYADLNEVKQDLTKINSHNPVLEKWDAYQQCELNIPIIARECIYQYKKQIKEDKKND